jgi:hypothetical protein
MTATLIAGCAVPVTVRVPAVTNREGFWIHLEGPYRVKSLCHSFRVAML